LNSSFRLNVFLRKTIQKVQSSNFAFLRKTFLLTVSGVSVLALFFLFSTVTQVGIDFENHFLPAGKALLAGSSPYDVPGYYSPPWILPLFALLALIPQNYAWGLFSIASFLAYAVSFQRMGASPLALLPLMLSAWVLSGLSHGNIDWIVLLGATLPPAIGIWFVMVKPQMGIVLLVLWSFNAYQTGGIRSLLKLLLPISTIWAISLLFGLYQNVEWQSFSWNTSFFPWTLPLGILLTYLAIKKDDGRIALIAAPLLSPYVAFHSWVTINCPFVERKRLLILLFILSWLALVLRYSYHPAV
jgi:hypothetical protein